MNQDFNISYKRGCNRDSLNLILVKANVDFISKVFNEYFDLKVYPHSNLEQYIQLNKEASNRREKLRSVYQKIPASKWRKTALKPRKIIIYYPLEVWQYKNHNWSVIFLNGDNDSIAFAFSTLLDTNVITFWESKYACCSEYKLFRRTELAEHYRFGFECGKLFDDSYWDLIVGQPNWLSELEEHKFCSLIRTVKPEEIEFLVETNRDLLCDRGFLDACLKYHNVYLPILEETPYHYRYQEEEDNLNLQQWDNSVQQLDLIMRSNYWSYYENNVPQKVIRS